MTELGWWTIGNIRALTLEESKGLSFDDRFIWEFVKLETSMSYEARSKRASLALLAQGTEETPFDRLSPINVQLVAQAPTQVQDILVSKKVWSLYDYQLAVATISRSDRDPASDLLLKRILADAASNDTAAAELARTALRHIAITGTSNQATHLLVVTKTADPKTTQAIFSGIWNNPSEAIFDMGLLMATEDLSHNPEDLSVLERVAAVELLNVVEANDIQIKQGYVEVWNRALQFEPNGIKETMTVVNLSKALERIGNPSPSPTL